MMLAHVMNPVVTGLLFAVVVTPLALLMRVSGKKFLTLSYDPLATSYWIPRDPPGPSPSGMSEQF